MRGSVCVVGLWLPRDLEHCKGNQLVGFECGKLIG